MKNYRSFALVFFALMLSMPFSAAAMQKDELFTSFKGETLAGAAFDLESFKGEPILL